METYIRQKLNDNTLSQAQHAYMKGKSVETEFYEVVGTIEKLIRFKEYNLGADLDLEAFNNVTVSAIRRALSSINIEPMLSNWIDTMLKTRIVNAEMGDSKLKVRIFRGTLPGSGY